MLVIPVGPIPAGATSIDIPDEFLAQIQEGDCFILSGGGFSETVCVSGFGSSRLQADLGASFIVLTSPTQYAYPSGSSLTGPLAGSSMPPTTSSAPATGTTSSPATVHDDPHVCALTSECFDIRDPSEYVLIRLPADVQEPPVLTLRADIGTDGVRPCGLFVKHVVLSGAWLDNLRLRVQPYTRDVGGSNWVGNKVMTNFSLQLGSSPWRSFTRSDSNRQVAVVGRLVVSFVWREQFGQRMEAQSLELSLGEGNRTAKLTISQASHQALNLDMHGFGQLGYSRMGGVLGTEGHSLSIEEATSECKASTSHVSQRHLLGQPPPERASTVRVSWG